MTKETCQQLFRADRRTCFAWLCKGFLIACLATTSHGQTPNAYKTIGTVVSIEPAGFTIQADSGSRLAVQLSDSATLLRVAPNEKDLKNATKAKAEEISVGDRIIVRGQLSEDQKTLLATSAIIMSKLDIARKQEADRADWQKHGVGGLVSSCDPSNGTITISRMAFGATKNVTIHVSKETIVHRYAPDSVRFADAVRGTLEQIKPGDQLRARGNSSADGAEFTADEIVSGSFRNIAGTVSSIDIARSTITVMDLKTKKPAIVKIAKDSQLRKLPPMMAQVIATRLKGGSPAVPQNGVGSHSGTPAAGPTQGRPAFAGSPSGRSPDLQQILESMPPVTLADLRKSDAVMIVATEGTADGGMTAITLLSGVEPILTSSSSSQAAFMSSWNLGSTPNGDAMAP